MPKSPSTTSSAPTATASEPTPAALVGAVSALDRLKALVGSLTSGELSAPAAQETKPGGDVIIRDPAMARALSNASLAGYAAPVAGLPGAQYANPLPPTPGPLGLGAPNDPARILRELYPYLALGTLMSGASRGAQQVMMPRRVRK